MRNTESMQTSMHWSQEGSIWINGWLAVMELVVGQIVCCLTPLKKVAYG